MREIFIERSEKLLRIALKDNGILSECFIEEEQNEPLPGELYKGVVKNIVPAIKSAFVDIGDEKSAYISLGRDVSLKKGDDVLIEIEKEPIDNKVAKATLKYSLPGRYIVLNRDSNKVSFSKKINDEEVKRSISEVLNCDNNLGVVVRTNAQNVLLEEVQAEYNELLFKLKEIENEFKYTLRPKKLYGDNILINKIVRDCVNSTTKIIYVSDLRDYKLLKTLIKKSENISIELYEGSRTLFDYYGIEKELLSLRHNKINLNCGGQIVIEKTEAMYVIDVNSAKNIQGKNREKNAEITNIEAAKEIVRQIRLRNLSGIILIDFINMREEKTKMAVYNVLKKEFEEDKNKTNVYPPTELNLVQVSRRRRGHSIYEYIEENCSNCRGIGRRLKLSYLSLLIRNEILKYENENSIKDFYIEINPEYRDRIKEDIFAFIRDIEAIDIGIYLNYVDEVEYFKVEPLLFKNQIENVANFKVVLE